MRSTTNDQLVIAAQLAAHKVYKETGNVSSQERALAEFVASEQDDADWPQWKMFMDATVAGIRQHVGIPTASEKSFQAAANKPPVASPGGAASASQTVPAPVTTKPVA